MDFTSGFYKLQLQDFTMFLPELEARLLKLSNLTAAVVIEEEEEEEEDIPCLLGACLYKSDVKLYHPSI